MKQNMGSTDRLIRTVIALLLVAAYAAGTVTGTIGIVFLILAAVFLLTSLVSFCPLYTVLGVNTCRRKKIS